MVFATATQRIVKSSTISFENGSIPFQSSLIFGAEFDLRQTGGLETNEHH